MMTNRPESFVNSVLIKSMEKLALKQKQKQKQQQRVIQFIICGGVGDGKSTLVDCLLLELQKKYCEELGVTEVESILDNVVIEKSISYHIENLSPSLRSLEGSATNDVRYRNIETIERKIIFADIPGDEQQTLHMVNGMFNANGAILVIDAHRGLLTQARRQACLLSLMGIRHVVLVINKMDQVDFDSVTYHRSKELFEHFVKPLKFKSLSTVPLSALMGENITRSSSRMPWHAGPTLMGCLEDIFMQPIEIVPFVFLIRSISRTDLSFRVLTGSVVQGSVRVGDEIRLTASGDTARVTDILTNSDSIADAVAGHTITLRLDKDIDAAPGGIVSTSQRPLELTDQFEATLVWLHEEAGLIGRNYNIELATQRASASITNIKYKLDVNSLAHQAARQLGNKDIGVCNISVNQPLAFDNYQNSAIMGGFILVDRFTHTMVAVGMIRHNLRRAQNVHKQALTISRAEREQHNGHKGKVIWFTGLSGSGKSTIANALEVALHTQGRRTYLLDGDNIRQGLNKDLGFTDADRVENIRRIAEVAKLMMDAGLIVMTAFISPFRREREMARELIGAENFVEVFVDTPLTICEQRDPKGLYKKARNGQLPNMTGISSPYEPPDFPQVCLNGSQLTAEESLAYLQNYLLSHFG